MSRPTLRPYQEATLDAVAFALRSGTTRQLVKAPTGTGKTVTFAALLRWPAIADWLQQFPSNERRMLVIAHREELLDQAADKIHRANPDLAIAIDQADRVASPHADVVIASIQTLAARGFSRLRRLIAYHQLRFRIVVVDEAHHAPAPTYRTALVHLGFLPAIEASTEHNIDGTTEAEAARIEKTLAEWDAVAPRDKLLLGVTATPNRSDAIGLGCIFQSLVHSYGLRQAIDDQWLVPLTPWAIETRETLDAVHIQGADFNQRELAETVNTVARNEVAVSAWNTYAYGRSTLAFTVDVQHAHDLAERFEAHGISARALSGETPREERHEILAAFQRGELPVVTNCMVLTEGTDLPRASCILHCKPTKSATLYEQMTGRGLRLFDGKDDCVVIDLVDLSRKHSLQTAPVLYGLPPKLKTDGTKLDRVVDAFEALLAKQPGFDPAAALADKVLTLEQLQAHAELVNVWAVRALGDFAAQKTLSWLRLSDDVYRLQYPWEDGQETLTVEKDLLGHWQVVVAYRPRGGILWAPRTIATNVVTAEAAGNLAEGFVQQLRSNVYRLKAVGASWTKRPASPAQLRLLGKLHVPCRPGLSSGEASNLIDLALARKGSRR